MPKTILAVCALALVLTIVPARAQTYDPRSPVCLHVFGELEGERMDCIFPNFAQCQVAASGRPATCLMNPYFSRASAVRSPRTRRHSR
ncbi:hypothetical protein UB31_20915 [Bradyrhizobium sp. LTSP849]|nr:hypothetical protein UP06_24645 [Bradyrhizobium sp. LTSP857]KJC46140.1 hypothetical protein UB31_20915 [Bradyrhizobium sp. LTSP849]